MINSTNLSSRLALDIKDTAELRQAAKQDSPEALKATAQQFEALFLNMVMKSMREATPQNSPFDSEQSRMFTSMLDQQFSQSMASRGIGLADVLVRQLSSMKPSTPEQLPSVLPPQQSLEKAKTSGKAPDSVLVPLAAVEKARSSRPAHVREFQERLGPHAEEASRATGIPAKFMLGQAALESGWGRREIKATDGTNSHNVFGIKATKGWKGKVVEAVTTEYVNGVPKTQVEKFRAYDSYADAFKDYARMLKNNPRYENVIANAQDAAGFAWGLQRAGYATDPQYAAKLTKIIKNSLSA